MFIGKVVEKEDTACSHSLEKIVVAILSRDKTTLVRRATE